MTTRAALVCANSRALVDAFGHIMAWEREDQVEGGQAQRRRMAGARGATSIALPEVAILFPTPSGGRAADCALVPATVRFQSGRFNFDWEALKPKETWDNKCADDEILS
jgi:lysine 2,3-aminomutase